jgi:hypothetical protein
MVDAAQGIVRQQGARGLYRGLGVTLVEIMPYAALQFGLYDLFNTLYARAQVGGRWRRWRRWRALAAGWLAGWGPADGGGLVAAALRHSGAGAQGGWDVLGCAGMCWADWWAWADGLC